MKSVINIFEITDSQPLVQWGRELMGERREEALKSLMAEGVVMESMSYFSVDEKHFVVGLMVGEQMRPSSDKLKINDEHKNIFLQVKKRKIALETLYSLGS